jgi:hypothetical protein
VTFVPEDMFTRNENGVAFVEDLNGNFQKGYKYRDGQATPIALGQKENPAARSLSELCIIDWYTCFPVENYLECYYTDSEYYFCEPGGGGEGGGGYGYGDSGDYSGGGGDGYGDGPSGTGDDCIQNQLITPCFASVADHVLQPSIASTLNFLIQDIFNSNDEVNLIIQEGSLTNQYGLTNYVESDYGNLNVYITIDPTKFSNPSKEFIGSVIYHECFHAVVDYLTGGNVPADDQHVAEYTTYLNLIASALQSAYPNMLPGDAKALLLKGLINLDGGMNPPAGYWKTTFVDQMLAHSNSTRSQVNSTFDRYEYFDTSGSRCN